MGQPLAKQGDKVVATDTHIILVPSPGGPVPTPIPHPFNGTLDASLSTNVMAMGMPAATLGSIAHNLPPHIPMGGSFSKPPTNMAQVITGSPSVMINGKPAARNSDTALTCNDPVDMPVGTVVAVGTVMVA
jgi:uncharacterized Zn-binding protein involved in type VI secretion